MLVWFMKGVMNSMYLLNDMIKGVHNIVPFDSTHVIFMIWLKFIYFC